MSLRPPPPMSRGQRARFARPATGRPPAGRRRSAAIRGHLASFLEAAVVAGLAWQAGSNVRAPGRLPDPRVRLPPDLDALDVPDFGVMPVSGRRRHNPRPHWHHDLRARLLEACLLRLLGIISRPASPSCSGSGQRTAGPGGGPAARSPLPASFVPVAFSAAFPRRPPTRRITSNRSITCSPPLHPGTTCSPRPAYGLRTSWTARTRRLRVRAPPPCAFSFA